MKYDWLKLFGFKFRFIFLLLEKKSNKFYTSMKLQGYGSISENVLSIRKVYPLSIRKVYPLKIRKVCLISIHAL